MTNGGRKQSSYQGLQDGGGVRRGDHLPLQKYIRNTSTCGTTPTEHLQNTGRRPQTSQKARKSLRTWVGQKKKEKNRHKRIRTGPHLWERAVKEEKFPHTRKTLRWWRQEMAGAGEASDTQRRVQQ